jgi:oligopeptide transport system substrate-binding protein
MAFSVPVMDRLRQRYADDFVSTPRFDTWYVGFNVSQPPFDDRRVRRAFVLATDKERLADVILSGYRFPATGGFIPPGMPGHTPGIGLPFDPHQARQLLAQAGYPEGRGFPDVEWLTILLADNVLEYLRAQWRENLGVDIPWERVGVTTFVERSVTAPTHVCVASWSANYPDPDDFLRESSFRPHTRWRDETYEQLIEEARRITDQGRRMELYRQADRILIEEAPIMPFVYGRWPWLVKPWVSGFVGSPVGPPLWKHVIIEPH